MRAVPVTVALAAAWGLGGGSATACPQGKLNGVDGNPATSGNGYYFVHVERQPGSGIGLYTATTGPLHAAGSGLNVLFGDGTPGTSYTTVRSYTSGTDYVQVTRGVSSSFVVVPLDTWAANFELTSTGFGTTYQITGRDALTIAQVVQANNTPGGAASVEVTTAIQNDGAIPVDIGLRHLWDFKVGQDDGPLLQELAPTAGVRLDEIEFVQPPFESFRVMDNELTPGAPTLAIVGTVHGPNTILPGPNPPDSLQFVCWQDAHRAAFDYTVSPGRSIATSGTCSATAGGGDSAALYYWGRNASEAITIAPGGLLTITASLYAGSPPMCTGVVQDFGQGCVGAGAVTPELSMNGCAEIGSTIALDIDRGVGAGRAALLFGIGRASLRVGSCMLFVPAPMLAVPVQLGGAPGVGGVGTATLPLTIPSATTGVGLAFTVQAFVLDPGAPSGLAATRGMQVFVGF